MTHKRFGCVRPGIEVLEARTLLAASPIKVTFTTINGLSAAVIRGSKFDDTITLQRFSNGRLRIGFVTKFDPSTSTSGFYTSPHAVQLVTCSDEDGNDTFDANSLPIRTILNGGPGDDTLFGGNAADVLRGGTGNDVLFGKNGHDILYGNAGTDYLEGGGGSDILRGGVDNAEDILEAGVLIYNFEDNIYFGYDTAVDFLFVEFTGIAQDQVAHYDGLDHVELIEKYPPT